jgi:hypothetical protein
MQHSSARRPFPRAGLRTAHGLASVVALALMATTGCAQDEETSARPASPTPLASLNTTAMQLPRIEFCQLVPDEAVRDALGSEPDSEASYGNGDQENLPGVGSEVVHELGCSWSTGEGAAARAWVFARPVDAAFAKTVVAAARETKGCTVRRGPAYGEPSLTQTCRLPDESRRVRHAGLFGQTWLSCEVVAGAGADDVSTLPKRSETWCVEVANALNTAR